MGDRSMLDLGSFLDPEQLGRLVPDALARYRPAVADGLAFFLGRLPPARAMAMLAEQAGLPEEAGVEERVVAAARHSPVLHKLGQVLARDRRLPASLRRLLQGLETMPPAIGALAARALVEAELGPLDRLGVRLDGPPLAEASVAVVAPFVWEGRRGVFKVLKPGIEAALAEDLELLGEVGAWLDARCRHYGLPSIEYEATFAQVRDLLRREVHLDAEQAHLAEARGLNRDAAVVVPEVFPLSTPRLTAMERVDGRKVTEVAGLPAAARRDLAGLVARTLVGEPIWSPAADALFHADPHAGNLLASDDGRLAILDWSLVGRLGRERRTRLTRILLAAAGLDAAAVLTAVDELAEALPDEAALRRVVDDALLRLVRGARPGLDWLTGLLDAAVLEAGARFGAELILFRKVVLTVEGVVADIALDVTLDQAVAAAFLARLGLETAPRLVALPWCRDVPSGLSNADLAQALTAAPLIGARCWALLWRASLDKRGRSTDLSAGRRGLVEERGDGA
jgi:ubiquinone biosynthesis protein